MPGLKRNLNAPTTVSVNATHGVFEIAGRKSAFLLRHPIDLDTHAEKGRFMVKYAPLGIEVYGLDQAEAATAFAEAFEDAWEWVNEVSVASLSGDAKALRRTFHELVRAVEPIE